MAAKAVTNDQIAKLIENGQTTTQQRFEELRADFNAKHKENVDRRHAIVGDVGTVRSELHLTEGRVLQLERDMRTVVGDNTGGSGLLHAIDKKVDKLQEDFSSLKSAVEDAPAIRKWVYGAIAVLGFLAISIPIVAVILFEILKLATKH